MTAVPTASVLRTIYLVRHGEAEASWGQSADPGLSTLGHDQARATAEQLVPEIGGRSTEILSSPLLRARQTAGPLAEKLSRQVRIEGRVREIPSPVPLAERQNWLRAFMRGRWSEQGAGLLAWRAAILDALTELSDQSVVFTHFLVLNAIVGTQLRRDETLVFWPANASVTTLREKDGGGWQVTLGEQMRSRVN